MISIFSFSKTGSGQLSKCGSAALLWNPIPNSTIPEAFYPGIPINYTLGSWLTILWDPGHPLEYAGIRNRDRLSSGIRTTYPLGFVLWDRTIWESRYNHLKAMYIRPGRWAFYNGKEQLAGGEREKSSFKNVPEKIFGLEKEGTWTINMQGGIRKSQNWPVRDNVH